MKVLILSLWAVVIAGCSAAQTRTINSVADEKSPAPIATIDLPAHPYMPLISADGQWVFVSISPAAPGSTGGVAVIRFENGIFTFFQMAEIEGSHPTGMALSHDGKLLFVANRDEIVVFATAELTTKKLYSVPIFSRIPVVGHRITSTADDHYLFVSDEGGTKITVVRLNADGSGSILGTIPIGPGVVSAVLSRDEKTLYVVSEVAPATAGWPFHCRLDGGPHAHEPPSRPEGAIFVIDAERAKREPEHSVLSIAPAECVPTRLVLSPDEKSAFVSVRQSGALAVFDVARLQTKPMQAKIARVSVGTPIGIELIENGAKVILTDMATEDLAVEYKNKYLDVIDAAKVSEGSKALIGRIRVGAYPRELRLAGNGRTLLVTNYFSNTLQAIDLKQLGSIIEKQ